MTLVAENIRSERQGEKFLKTKASTRNGNHHLSALRTAVPDLTTCRKDFPLLKSGIIYLDNGATTQKPQAVIDAMNKYYEEENANVHRGIYALSEQATQNYEQAHQIVADFINAQFEEIIFTKGTTESLNLLASSLGKLLQPGDEILLTEMEHHSNIVPWQQVAQERQAILKYIPLTKQGTLDMAKAKQLLTRKTKIVSVAHMSNVLGTINPVKELAQLAHGQGAVIIVDAAQSVPHLPVDVQDLDCDFLAFSGHKMLGPTGIGVLYGKKQLLEKLNPYQFGGGMIKEVTFQHSTWNDLPWKFEAGTPNIAGALGLAAAITYLQKIGMKNVARHGQELVQYALQQLSALPGLTVLGPREQRGPLVSFTLDGIHPHDIADIAGRNNVAVRAGHHCAMPLHYKLGIAGSTRASFSLYNTKDDIDALAAVLKKVKEVFQ